MRVSEVLQVQFPQASFVTWDTDASPQSGTFHTRVRKTILQKNHTNKNAAS
jgi:hypothetical protein